MPRNARNAVDIDHCATLALIPGLLTDLVAVPAVPAKEPSIEELAGAPVAGMTFTCPDCNGPLSEVRAPGEQLVRFRCHVGHSYSIMSLRAAQEEARESSLWMAIRTLEDEAVLSERMVELKTSLPERDALRSQAALIRTLAAQIREGFAALPGPIITDVEPSSRAEQASGAEPSPTPLLINATPQPVGG